MCDAQVHASGFRTFSARDRVRSCVRPLARHTMRSLAVMEIRGTGANQPNELFALGASVHFLIPIEPIICP